MLRLTAVCYILYRKIPDRSPPGRESALRSGLPAPARTAAPGGDASPSCARRGWSTGGLPGRFRPTGPGGPRPNGTPSAPGTRRPASRPEKLSEACTASIAHATSPWGSARWWRLISPSRDAGHACARARAEVIMNIEPNKLNVGGQDFRVKYNPSALGGAFVYSPKTRYRGVQRNLIWWAPVPKRGGTVKVYPLNGPSQMVTPGLEFPMRAGLTKAPQAYKVNKYIWGR